jgi:NADH-quinone oxidoreductase subunit K
VRVWLISTAVVLAWVSLIVIAPAAKAGGHTAISGPLYGFFSYACHQLSARSFHVEGEQFAVCSRCFGVYFGLLAGFVVYPLWRPIDEIVPIRRFWLFLSLVPIGIDWSLGIFGIFLNRKNIIIILMSVELILLSVNLNLVAFSAQLGNLVGQVFAMFILTVAAAEAAIGLAIFVIYFRNRGSIAVEDVDLLKG